MPSSRLLMSLARLLSDCEVKKLVGLSSAELTLLPVARRFCVVESKSAVACSERRFWRTEAERTIPGIFESFWFHQAILDCPEGYGAESNKRSKNVPAILSCNSRRERYLMLGQI